MMPGVKDGVDLKKVGQRWNRSLMHLDIIIVCTPMLETFPDDGAEHLMVTIYLQMFQPFVNTFASLNFPGDAWRSLHLLQTPRLLLPGDRLVVWRILGLKWCQVVLLREGA